MLWQGKVGQKWCHRVTRWKEKIWKTLIRLMNSSLICHVVLIKYLLNLFAMKEGTRCQCTTSTSSTASHFAGKDSLINWTVIELTILSLLSLVVLCRSQLFFQNCISLREKNNFTTYFTPRVLWEKTKFLN